MDAESVPCSPRQFGNNLAFARWHMRQITGSKYKQTRAGMGALGIRSVVVTRATGLFVAQRCNNLHARRLSHRHQRGQHAKQQACSRSCQHTRQRERVLHADAYDLALGDTECANEGNSFI